jgi:myo-inositol-1(or 4)-monophosphatase
MNADNIALYRAFAEELADAARAAILPYFRKALNVEDKGGKVFDPVTEADRAAETAMRTLIEARFPSHGILGEEFGEKPSQDGFCWVLDPIDGTRAFISGLPLWGVLIALAKEDQPIIGIMDQPYLDERFIGFPGGAELKAHGETKPLKTRACANLQSATLSSTDPYLFEDAEAEAFARVRGNVKLTRFGYDCYAYAMLAAGHIDIVVESGLKPYDIQALIPIIRGAGGDVISWTGGDASQGGRVLAIGDKGLQDQAMGLLHL